jgi:carbon monoxide dehydrogenase subunit G
VKLEGTYKFDASPEQVWEAFMDPEILAKTMPGCEKLESTGDNQYKGRMRMRVGPVQGIFEGNVKLTNLEEPESYNMEVSGRGPSGFMDGEGTVRLEEADGGCIMHYSGTAQVGGRLAQVGQRLMDSSARAIVKQSLDNLAQQIAAREEAASAGSENGEADTTATTPPPAPEAPSQTEFALGVAREMVSEYIPAEQQGRLLRSGAMLLVSYLVLRILAGWWTDMLARKIAAQLKEQGGE